MKQIRTSVDWLRAFTAGQKGTIVRTFSFESHFGTASPLEITCDASIWGIGGCLSLKGTPLAYFHDTISAFDETTLGFTRGQPEGQQAFEGLALLVATRLWSKMWRSKRFRLALRSDNLGALSIFSAVNGKSSGMNLVAREFALDLGEGVFTPELIQHVPGVMNKTADALSRKTDPVHVKTWVTPAFLRHAKLMTVPPRDAKWWRSKAWPGSA